MHDQDICSLLKRSMINFGAADLDGLVRIVKRKLRKIRYRPHLIDGCLAGTRLGLASNSSPGIHMHYEFNLVCLGRSSSWSAAGRSLRLIKCRPSSMRPDDCNVMRCGV